MANPKAKSKKVALQEMLQDIQTSKPAVVESNKLLTTKPDFEMWKKIKFKDKDGKIYDAHIYHVEGHTYYVSQNKGFNTFCHAQTWVINKNQII